MFSAFRRRVLSARALRLWTLSACLLLPSFAFAQTGTVTGTITNAATGSGIQNVTVAFCHRTTSPQVQCETTSTNASGAYSIALAPRTYFMQTLNDLGFTNEIFPDILCVFNCDTTITVNSGTPIQVAAGSAVAGRDIALDPGGSISGKVTDAATAAPIAGVGVLALARVSGQVIQTREASTDNSGIYVIRGLPAGRYFLTARNTTHVDEIYDNIPCLDSSCSFTTALQSGAPVDVAQGAAVQNRDFALALGGTIRGTIRNAVGGTPVGFAFLEVYRRGDAGVTFAASGSTQADGTYAVGGLAPGTYFVTTDFNDDGFANEVYDNVPCPGDCQPGLIATGEPLTVTSGSVNSGRDFVVVAGGGISGMVTDTATGQPIQGGTQVNLFSRLSDGSPSFARAVRTDTNGAYTIPGLQSGTYFAFTSTASRSLNEIYNDIPCPQGTCTQASTVTIGSPIVVTAPAIRPAINFNLLPRNEPPGAPGSFTVFTAGGITTLAWTESFTGSLASSYQIEGGVTPGGTVATLTTTNLSLPVPGIPPGRFFLRVRGSNAFGPGATSTEFVLVKNANGTAAPEPPLNPFVWVSAGRLTVTFAEPRSGGLPDGYVLEVGSSAGTANLGSVPLSSRFFTFRGVPPGVFFARIRARVGAQLSAPSRDVMLVVGNVPSPPDVPSFSQTTTGSTVNLSWTLPFFGVPTSYIIEAGSSAGASDLAVFNTGSATRTLSFSGVPPGTYFLRIRAVNASGAGPASNELTIVIR